MVSARLLIVDDSPEVATLVRLLCRRAGWTCVVAESAEDGLEILPREPTFDLLLIDINLPGMNGLDLSRQLLAQGRHRLAVFLQSSLIHELGRAVRLGVSHAVYKDSLSQPGRWVQRVEEILTLSGSKCSNSSLEYEGNQLLPVPDLTDTDWLRLLSQELGPERGQVLAPELLARVKTHQDSGVRSAPSLAPGSDSLARELLDLCCQLLGREEVAGLKTALRPFLPAMSSGGPSA